MGRRKDRFVVALGEAVSCMLLNRYLVPFTRVFREITSHAGI